MKRRTCLWSYNQSEASSSEVLQIASQDARFQDNYTHNWVKLGPGSFRAKSSGAVVRFTIATGFL